MHPFEIYVQELRNPDIVYKLQVRWWTTIKDVKDQLHKLTHRAPAKQRLFHPSEPKELRNLVTLHDVGLEESGGMLRVVFESNEKSNFILSHSDAIKMDESCANMIADIRHGLQGNKIPAKSDILDGTSGVYFMRSTMGAYISVFKPRDEEQGMPNNPKDHADIGDASLREDFIPGEGCFREQAAYIMDKRNFCRVPPTTLVHCEHPIFNYPKVHGKQCCSPYPKYGSMQLFIKSEDSFENFGRNFFSDIEVQKIALLDIRLLNCDRNSANILVVRRCHDNDDHNDSPITTQFPSPNPPEDKEDDNDLFSYSGGDKEWNSEADFSCNSLQNYSNDDYILVPIDHGYCLPSKLKIFQWDWSWLDYNQVSKPIHPHIVQYMKSLDIEKIISELREQLPLSENSFFHIRIAHQLLLDGIDAGLTLKDIADIILREDEDEPSKLELLIMVAEDNALKTTELHYHPRRVIHNSYSPTSTSSSSSQPLFSRNNISNPSSSNSSFNGNTNGSFSMSNGNSIPSLSEVHSKLQSVLESESGDSSSDDKTPGSSPKTPHILTTTNGILAATATITAAVQNNNNNGSNMNTNGNGNGNVTQSKNHTIDSNSNGDNNDNYEIHKNEIKSVTPGTMVTTLLYNNMSKAYQGLTMKRIETVDGFYNGTHDKLSSNGTTTGSNNNTNNSSNNHTANANANNHMTQDSGSKHTTSPTTSPTTSDEKNNYQSNSKSATTSTSTSLSPNTMKEVLQTDNKQILQGKYNKSNHMKSSGTVNNLVAFEYREKDSHDSNNNNNDSNNNSNDYKPVPINRVVSFTAFDSAPLFDLNKSPRPQANAMYLKRERYKMLESTQEFRDSRLKFAMRAVTALVYRSAKQMNGDKKLNRS
eukprot:gene11140-23281_t